MSVRPAPHRLLVSVAPAVLIALTQGLTTDGQVLPRAVWLALAPAFAVFSLSLYWLLAVSVADGYIAVRRGFRPQRLRLADLDSVEVKEAGRLGYVVGCRQAGQPELKVPLTMMRPSDQRLVIEAIRTAVRPGILRGGAALPAFAKTP
ncbi:hypothetical protein [Streptomyces virginiae]|uniref:hypothetical protein n=1 Tax=Streptomyces virginiae TaxID=1961 RepID=UPI002DBBEDB5|nr:hypothetical protein [Streptomyces sp. CMAA1738]MEC4576259.1 hypothetical protein [Streptomyces sp. CMAA1738]